MRSQRAPCGVIVDAGIIHAEAMVVVPETKPGIIRWSAVWRYPCAMSRPPTSREHRLKARALMAIVMTARRLKSAMSSIGRLQRPSRAAGEGCACVYNRGVKLSKSASRHRRGVVWPAASSVALFIVGAAAWLRWWCRARYDDQ